MSKDVCDWQYISPDILQDYRDRRVIPYTQFAGKKLYKASHLEKFDENYKGWPHFTNRNVINSKIINKMNDYYTFV